MGKYRKRARKRKKKTNHNEDHDDVLTMLRKEKASTVVLHQNMTKVKMIPCQQGEGQKGDCNETTDMGQSTTGRMESSGENDQQLQGKTYVSLVPKRLECHLCYDSLGKKELVIALGNHCFLGISPYGSLTSGHTVIVPLQHLVCMNDASLEERAEMDYFKSSLVDMFAKVNQYVIFVETVTPIHIRRKRHTYVDCIVVNSKAFKEGPRIFCEEFVNLCKEGRSNAKYMQISNVKHGINIPKSFPYVSVEFGRTNGVCHVIEGNDFDFFFAKDVIASLMGLMRGKTRFDEKKASNEWVRIMKMYAPFDWTQQID